MEQRLKSLHPIVLAIGSGRSLRAAGRAAASRWTARTTRSCRWSATSRPDGSASFYDVIVRIADAVQAPHYPLPLPVIASTSHEQRLFFEQASVRQIVSLAQSADVTYVGIGDLGENPPLLQDGFITRMELQALEQAPARSARSSAGPSTPRAA